ncbi:MAG: N-6 DNA methylase [Flavobacteriaceae bacterium]|nr:N-6 DNA methylase [Flavobacteriaceae bacterium]
MNQALKHLYEELIHTNEAEANVESALKSIFRFKNREDDWEQNYSNSNGRCDLISFSNKIIIEAKRRGEVHVDVNKRQLLRYLDGVVPNFDNQLWNQGKDVVWKGLITDGREWACFDYDRFNRELRDVSHRVLETPARINEFIQSHIYQRWDGIQKIKIPSKENLLEKDFKPIFTEIRNAIESDYIEITKEYQTKIGIWRIILKNSGVIPDQATGCLEAGIFWRHSFIVSISRIIIGHLDNPTLSKEELVKYIGNGFHAWLLEHRKTRRLMVRLASEIQKYQWAFYSQDVLKYLYHTLTPSKQRKEFGEFFTPDFLAKDIVHQVLDDQWLDESIERAYRLVMGDSINDAHLGVLDPSCGSGTFLLQSAIYIRERIRKAHKNKLHQSSKIIARLVHGIDIHPIAVEMSKATLRTILPESLNKNEYRICLGSSLNEQEIGQRSLHIEIKTPKTNLEIPDGLYRHPSFSNIIAEINQSIVNQKRVPEFKNMDGFVKNQAMTLFHDLEKIFKEQGNHVWEWVILNRIYLSKIFLNGVGRIVGNPPWLVQNNAQDAIRKAVYKRIAHEEGVYTRTRGYLANVDLAAAFTTRTTRLYLPQNKGRYGWVLPNSPLKGQTWKKWRDGNWTNIQVQHQEMWDLTDVMPPIFDHSPNGCSVVIGETTNQKKHEDNHEVFHYSGDYTKEPFIKKISQTLFNSSSYLKRVKRGVIYTPYCYYQVIKKEDRRDGLSTILTPKSKRGRWQGCGYDGTIETKCLIPLINHKTFKRLIESQSLNYQPEMWLIAPLDEHKELMLSVDKYGNENLERKKLYPKLHHYWSRCQTQYEEKRDENKSQPLLELNYNYKRNLENELTDCNFDDSRLKVIYNASGNILRSCRICKNILISPTLYYLLSESKEEAQYLVGVINAPIMQAAWRQTKTSSNHYDTRPLARVPVPVFDRHNKLHMRIAKEIDRLEKLNTIPDFSGLNPLLKELLPYYASLTD